MSFEGQPWYVLRTRSNFERVAAEALAGRGLEQYLPLCRRRPTSRRGNNYEVLTPLFPGYLFCRFETNTRTLILSTPGVVAIVAFGGKPEPIAADELAAIQTAIDSGREMEPWPYLREGQKVRVVRGGLKGVEGILLKKQNWRIVISVHLLCRSVAVEVDPESLAPV